MREMHTDEIKKAVEELFVAAKASLHYGNGIRVLSL